MIESTASSSTILKHRAHLSTSRAWHCVQDIAAKTGAAYRTVQELLSHKDLRTTMIYTHVLNRGPAAVRSLADNL